MSKYHVLVPEVHYQAIEVEAESSEQAVRLVLDGEGEPLDDTLEFSHRLCVQVMSVTDLATGEVSAVTVKTPEN